MFPGLWPIGVFGSSSLASLLESTMSSGDLHLLAIGGAAPASQATEDAKSTVLIVDDLEINRRLLKAILKTSPYRILEARRASEALEILDKEKVDLVILELMIPEMSGPEFCRAIKANRKTQLVPVLIMTSVQGVENEIAGIASGADEFL